MDQDRIPRLGRLHGFLNRSERTLKFSSLLSHMDDFRLSP